IATVTIQRGIDVRDFSLVSFGGAGGAHAVALAEELSMAEAIVPPMPGTFSAVGLLATEMRHDYVTATGGIVAEEADVAGLEKAFLDMEQQGRDLLTAQGFADDRIRLTRLADLKVVGQTYELLLPLPGRGPVTEAGIAALVRDFGALYRERYAFFFEGEPIEIVNLRLSAEGLNPPVEFPESAGRGASPAAAQSGSRPIYFDGPGWTETPIFDRSRLARGMMVPGPAAIEEDTSATLVPPGRTAAVAPDFGLIVDLRGP
ncbi:MAG: hypothetical protein OXF89_16975, partial [Rhodospirillaceae bacterium]|nr:hypothetical protein [Rhodospirillaceae bacterium]